MKIIKYGGHSDIDVEFLDEFHYIVKHNTYSNFKSGTIRNPYDRTLLGIGYAGVGDYPLSDHCRQTKEYMAWTQMLNRCYNDKWDKKSPSYNGIATVCEEWHNFQNFAKWYSENYYKVKGRLHIDKDILFLGNKVYCSEKCLLVPQRINMLFTNKPNIRNLPNGITKYTSGYLAKYNNEELGVYNTLEEAFTVYSKKKKEEIIRVANDYKGIIPKRVYDALISYEVNIETDKNYIV